MLVGGSAFVCVLASSSVAFDVMASAVVTSAVMAASMVSTTVVLASLTSVAFRVCGPHDSESESPGDRKDEPNLLQHFCFSSWALKTTYSPKRSVNGL
jgi:hypothetical protein